MTDKLLVFVPAYNCEPQIGTTLRRISGDARRFVAEIIVVDNGSKDGTVREASRALDELSSIPGQVVRNSDNYNLGGSHKSAFRYAREGGFTHVIVLHGDDQADINDVVPLLERGTHRRYDACLGARFMSSSELKGYSRFRTVGNHVFNLLFTAVSGRRVHDLGSGLNVFARSVFCDEDVHRYADDLRFNIYLLLGLIHKKFQITFFPITWKEEDQVSNVRLWSQSKKTLSIAVEYMTERKRFFQDDHREVARDAYSFDVLHRNAAAEGMSAHG